MRPAVALLAAILCLSLTSCASLARKLEKPRVHVRGVEITNVSLVAADMVFDLEVENPNRLSFVLETVEYRVRINNEPLLDGRQDLRTEIAGHSAREVDLPVTMRFTDVARVLRSLKDERHAGYDLDAELWFTLPVLGRLHLPVHQKGDVSLDSLRIRL